MRPSLRATIVFLAVAFAIYGNALGNGFVFDDDQVLVPNTNIRSVEGLGRILREGYRPVRHLSYALDYALFGRQAWGYHLSSVLYHALATFLVFATVRRLAPRAAWPAALLFAVHPVQTEAVAYVSGRRDLLVTIFFLLGFLSHLAYRETGRLRHVAALVLCLALAAGSKESAFALPAVLLLYDLLVDPPTLRRGLLFHAPFALLAVAYGIHVALGDASQQEGFHGGSALVHYLAVPCLYALYVGRLLFPVRLLADYSLDAFPLPRSPVAPSFLGSALVLLALVGAVFHLRRRAPLVAFGIAWFLVTLLPVVQIIPFHELAAEHHLYLASFGLCLALGVVFERVALHRPARVAGVALLVVLALRASARNRDWKDSETLWAVTARDAPLCARAQYNTGFLMAVNGRYEDALPPLRAAVRIRGNSQDLYGLGSTLLALGREEEAVRELERALAAARKEKVPAVRAGTILMALGRPMDALLAFDVDLRDRPWDPRPLFHRGLCYEMVGDPAAALREYERMLAQMPGDYGTLLRAADLVEQRGDRGRAAALRAQAQECAPLGQ